MVTLIYSSDGARLVAVYNNGKLLKENSAGMAEGDVLKLFGFHGTAILNSDFDSENTKNPITLPNDYKKYENYEF